MNARAAAAEAQAYYRLTEESYRALDEGGTNFMNLGLWPALSVRLSQERLCRETLRFARDGGGNNTHEFKDILELGSGWGASRALVHEQFPAARYLGINSSNKQIEFSQSLNVAFPHTYYQLGTFEELVQNQIPKGALAFAIEAMLHVQQKEAVIQKLAAGQVRTLVLAEICTTHLSQVLENPLFNPSLKYLWSSSRYQEALAESGFKQIKVRDLSEQVFAGWSEALDKIESSKFAGHPRILSQFQASYRALADLAAQGLVSYVLIRADLESELS